MQSFAYTITDPVGLHARPAANLARFAATLGSAVRVQKEGAEKAVDAKSMIAIMTLGIRTGDVAVFSVEGADEEAERMKLETFCREHL